MGKNMDNSKDNNKEKNKVKRPGYMKNMHRWQLVLPLVLCVLGIMLNLGGKMTATYMGLPFYLECAGTILVSALGGYIPGILAALVTNQIIFITDPDYIYLAPISIIIAIITAMAYSKGYLLKFRYLVLYIFLISAVSLGIGAIAEWVPDGSADNFFSWFTGKALMEFADKIISVCFVSLILFLIPKNLWSRFEMTLWMQDPDAVKKEDSDDKSGVFGHNLSVKAKLVTCLIVISITIATCGVSICLMLFRDYSVQQHTYLAEGVAALASTVIDGDRIDDYLNNGEDTDGYKETQKLLENIQKNTADVEYVYVYKIQTDGCHVVFDTDPDLRTRGKVGAVIPFDESFMPVVPDLLSGKRIDPLITDDTYGWLLTAYEPVYDSSGECVCYAAADITMKGLAGYEKDFFYRQICIFIGFFALIVAVSLWIAHYFLLLPLNTMARVASGFGYDDEFARRENIQKITQLDIGTGDEVENLYRALIKTTEESTRFFEENKQNNEKISALQNGLVLVLADMVENRDGSTGDHVRKTAAYVNITAKKMKELGYYKDKLTDQFIDDITRSAPLHDIGKIAIPDAVLNAPRKLTDKEFEIMKTHAARGRKVIEQVIASIPDADYLEEAKNVAGYHHEKWNGKGYPEGLAGEDIPLAARIMAVADVFDALVSKRCYKESFDYSKAFNIIREDAGSHFDPLVVDAFLKAEEDVLEIAERFKENDGKIV